MIPHNKFHTLKRDNGLEFEGREVGTFNYVIVTNGIKLFKGRPYTPTDQGKIERWHRTLDYNIEGKN